MFERHVTALHMVEPTGGDNAALRERLKPGFPPGTTRRMTLLGMMVGTAVREVSSGGAEALVYASRFGESVALEGYLSSFPTPSPTLFQTSIHPSGIQQGLIVRQQAVREVIPLAGGPELVLQSALAAMLNPASTVVWCGGDERGTWLRDLGAAADRSHAFALALQRSAGGNPLGRLRLEPTKAEGRLSLAEWHDILRARRAWRGPVGSGWQLGVDWT